MLEMLELLEFARLSILHGSVNVGIVGIVGKHIDFPDPMLLYTGCLTRIGTYVSCVPIHWIRFGETVPIQMHIRFCDQKVLKTHQVLVCLFLFIQGPTVHDFVVFCYFLINFVLMGFVCLFVMFCF